MLLGLFYGYKFYGKTAQSFAMVKNTKMF